MTYNLQAALLAAATTFALSSSAASAQVKCDGGRTAGGECVDRELTTSARQSSVIFSQPKISHTAFPVLPSVDNTYRYPHQLIPDQLPTTPTGTAGPILE